MRRVDWGEAEVERLIRQRPPFRFLSRICAWSAQVPFLHGSFEIAPEEPILGGHFPGEPIWPGACTIEGLAQACGALEALLRDGPASKTGQAVIGSVNVRLLVPVRPGVRLDYRVWRISALEGLLTWRVEAAVGPQIVARGSLVGGRLGDPSF